MLDDVSERPEVVDHGVNLSPLVVAIPNVVDISNDDLANPLLAAESDEAMNDRVDGVSEPSLPLTIQPPEPLGCVFPVRTLELRLVFGNLFGPVPPVCEQESPAERHALSLALDPRRYDVHHAKVGVRPLG